MSDLLERQTKAAQAGMSHSLWAEVHGDKVAIHDPIGQRTFRQINEAANKVVRLLRERGLKEGDAVALLCSNRAEFVEVLSACRRGGYRLTPVNWHLNADEVEYIINDCDAKALFAETRYPSGLSANAPQVSLKVAIGDGDAPGFESYAKLLAQFDGADILDPAPGSSMLYTSGTTGRPKGVYRRPIGAMLGMAQLAQPDDVQLCAGPAYHAAPLAFDVRASMAMGIPLVFVDRWDSEGVLKTIEKYKVTRAHLVPIMFQRLLNLPEDVRKKYDVSSLRYIIHGAAPCPPEVKRAMIEWVGPIINEYYAGSEGGAGFVVSSEEWLTKPGTVGKLPDPTALKILDDDGNDVKQGEAGTLYFRVSPIAPFEYYKDPAKTAAAHRGDYFTLGDVGYLDADGYLFLTGRTAECIISGGVNIYPQEIDNELIKHPAVEDSCTIGVPNEEWGEEVKSVVTLNPGYVGSDDLAADIQTFARAHLAGFKVPRSVEFVGELPRSPAGKIQRKTVREPYWAGRARQI
ncbi:MAG TPA: AMP-binding protein [Caulobacteraceae bacterium]|nr:AMP-binding protein [Caulobacteraceae bacterium]